jgi:hypothetical protein
MPPLRVLPSAGVSASGVTTGFAPAGAVKIYFL